MNDRALVVGGGIAGLAAAIGLQRAGQEVVVLERAPALSGVGAGISLWPNAVNALRRLGLGDAVEAAGAPAHDATFHSWTGLQLGTSITAQLQGRFGAPLLIVHRARLQAVLRQALGPCDLRLGGGCEAGTQDEREAAGHLAGGAGGRGGVGIGGEGGGARGRGAVLAG